MDPRILANAARTLEVAWGSNVISAKATWFSWSTRLLPEACGWSAAFYKHFPMRSAACVPFRSAPRTVSSNDRLQSCASRPQLRTIDASGPFDARLGCKMDCSFLQRQPLLLHLWIVFPCRGNGKAPVAAYYGLTFFASGAWTLSEQTTGESAWLCLGGERPVENILNCSMLYVHVAACFTGKKLHSCVLQLWGGVTARSNLCPIRVQWLQAVFMRLLVF